ncbi:PASTA domain-containing protein [Streptomyces bacillaris]
MRIPRRLVPVALAGLLALAGCSGGSTSQAESGAPATPSPSAASATATATETAGPSPSPTPTPDPVMPALHSRTYEQARAELVRQGISTALLKSAAQHKDVTLPPDHDSWYVCDASPRIGSEVTATTTVTLRLAQDFSDCTTSFNGYLHQKNDPAYTPPAPKPKPAPTTQAPAPALEKAAPKPAPKPVGGSMITCSDGKQGYACTSNGHPVVDGQFCPKADRGRTLKATNGTTVTCSYDPSVRPYRWQ